MPDEQDRGRVHGEQVHEPDIELRALADSQKRPSAQAQIDRAQAKMAKVPQDRN